MSGTASNESGSPLAFAARANSSACGASSRVKQFQDSPLADGWGVAPLPYFAGGEIYTPTDSWAVGVSAYSEHKNAAEEFGRFLSMSTDGGNLIS